MIDGSTHRFRSAPLSLSLHRSSRKSSVPAYDSFYLLYYPRPFGRAGIVSSMVLDGRNDRYRPSMNSVSLIGSSSGLRAFYFTILFLLRIVPPIDNHENDRKSRKLSDGRRIVDDLFFRNIQTSLSLSLSVSGSKNSKDPAGRRRGERRTHLKTLKKKERRTVTRFIDEVDRGSRCTWLETDDLCKWSR